MGIVTSIVGKSGVGKSTSFRTLFTNGVLHKDVLIIRMGRKPLPFRAELKKWDKDKGEGDFIYANDGDVVVKVLEKFTKEYGKKIIIIDDSTFAMTDYFMKTALEVGFNKFSVNALKYYSMLKAAELTADDVRVYVVNHIDEDANGLLKVKTIGKMLDEKVDIPSLLTVVLQAEKTKDGYKFITNKRTNADLAKSPMGMFDDEFIDNDLRAVDEVICEYYNTEPLKF